MRSRYTLYFVSLFAFGVLLSPYGRYDALSLVWLVGLLAGITAIFWDLPIVRSAGLGLICVASGYIYPYLVHRDHLIELPSSFGALIDVFMQSRARFVMALQNILTEPHASLASGFVLGTGAGFPRDLKQAFINTGTIHLVAVSGFNVTIVIKLFSDMLRPLGRWVSFITGTLAIVAFIILVGGQASVVRAGIMGWLFIVARFAWRLPHIKNALFVTGFLMIVQEPHILVGDIGFQLSFLSMLGLIYISPLIGWAFSLSKHISVVPKVILDVLRETLSAQIAVALLVAGYFGRLSLIAIIPNVLIVPLIAPIMIICIVVGLLALLSPAYTILVALPLQGILWIILKIILVSNSIPFASVSFSNVPWVFVGIGYCCLISVIIWLHKKKHIFDHLTSPIESI